jgi:replicative DNA helicase
MAANMAVRGNGAPVGIFSLEMSADQLAMRLLCSRSRVNMKRVKDGMVAREQQQDLARTAEELKKAPLWIEDSGFLRILDLRAKARRLHSRQKLGMIVIDYLQLITGSDPRVAREQQIAEISRGCKALAKELEVPVLVLSQLNRAAEKERREPRLSDLRESGAIEQDADVVLLMAPGGDPEETGGATPHASHQRNLIVAKNRNGPVGEVPLTFLPHLTRFENHQKEQGFTA